MAKHEEGEEHDVWIVTVDHQWPINVYTTEVHAIGRYREEKNKQGEASYKVHIWKGKLLVNRELELVVPEPYLEAKDA